MIYPTTKQKVIAKAEKFMDIINVFLTTAQKAIATFEKKNHAYSV
jgi:hypothetical protein